MGVAGTMTEACAGRSGWAGDMPRWLLDWSAGRTFHEDPRLDAAVRAITSSLAESPEHADPVPVRRTAPALSHEVATEDGLYIVRGSRVPAPGSPVVLVTLERRPRPLPPAEELCRRHGLTRKEARVALLLAEGRSNAQIARELFISAHTARHHTESVLLKLGVHSRREVPLELLRRKEVGAAA